MELHEKGDGRGNLLVCHHVRIHYLNLPAQQLLSGAVAVVRQRQSGDSGGDGGRGICSKALVSRYILYTFIGLIITTPHRLSTHTTAASLAHTLRTHVLAVLVDSNLFIIYIVYFITHTLTNIPRTSVLYTYNILL